MDIEEVEVEANTGTPKSRQVILGKIRTLTASNPLASSRVRLEICVSRFSIFAGTETVERGQKWECGESVCGHFLFFLVCFLGVN